MKFIDTSSVIVRAGAKPTAKPEPESVCDAVGAFPAPEDSFEWGAWVELAYPDMDTE